MMFSQDRTIEQEKGEDDLFAVENVQPACFHHIQSKNDSFSLTLQIKIFKLQISISILMLIYWLVHSSKRKLIAIDKLYTL